MHLSITGGGLKFFRRADLIKAEEEKRRQEQERLDREKEEAKRKKEQVRQLKRSSCSCQPVLL